MALPQLKPATYQDLCAAPEHLVAELIKGTLYTNPRHAHASSSLGGELMTLFDKGKNGQGGWWILDEPEIHLGFDVVVPDIAGWRRERMPRLPDTAYFELAPDWVCEVLSPGTARQDRALKMPIYAAHGMLHIWLIDPLQRTLEAFENTSGKWLLLQVLENDNAVSLPPFDAISFNLADLWAD
ncbi:MAG: Uma2 family endonuclease [Methylococcaceae bacterium]|nr:Uma2 family endonuclease [Methylococcaceae bacterium]